MKHTSWLLRTLLVMDCWWTCNEFSHGVGIASSMIHAILKENWKCGKFVHDLSHTAWQRFRFDHAWTLPDCIWILIHIRMKAFFSRL
jgi:hypothetical protein